MRRIRPLPRLESLACPLDLPLCFNSISNPAYATAWLEQAKRSTSPHSARSTAIVLPANSGTRGLAFRACIGLHQLLQFVFQLQEIGLRMLELVAQNLQAGAPRRERNAEASGMLRQVHQLLSGAQPVVAWGETRATRAAIGSTRA